MIPFMMLCAILATIILDSLIDRPISASVTTLLPGFAYGTALVMKVCLAEALVAAVIALASRKGRREDPSPAPAQVVAAHDPPNDTKDLSDTSTKIPIWSILSVSLTPLAPLLGAIVVIAVQALVDKPDGISMSYIPMVARTGVLAMLVCLAAGVVSAVVGVFRREPPRLLPLLGLVINAFLIVMFWHLEFHKLGYDQDRGAPL